MTEKRCNGIKTEYWSAAKKEELVQRLAAYENTGLEPEDIKKAFNKETALTLAAQYLGVSPERLRRLAGGGI